MKIRYFGILMLLAVIAAGCDNQETNLVDTPTSPYIGGNKGLVAEIVQMGVFNDASNTEEIFEGETFPIEITLKNKGESDVATGNATVTLLGINLRDFDNVPNQELSNTQLIEKVEKDVNEQGGEVTIDFTSGTQDARYKVPLSGSSYDVSVFARLSYKYQTKAAVPKVCFKENLRDTSVCDVEGTKDVFSSGAPIKVTNAEEKTAGTGKVAVEFTIENVDGGDVTLPNQPFDSRFDQLAFSVSDANEWECKSGGRDGVARLDTNGKAVILCRLKNALPANALYTKELDLTLSYAYSNLVHKQIRVKKQ